MNFNNVEFLLSAASPKNFPDRCYPEIAFAGKSNVGKSSVINRILQRKNFARVGEKPGKTIHVNYFVIDKKCYFVDLPGYGYANVSKAQQKKFGLMIEEYLTTRENLRLVFMLIDFRHKPGENDILMYDYYHYIANNLGVMLFGVGLNDFAEKVLNIYMISTHTPHNSILEIIAAWGIVGLILVLLLLVAIIIDSKSHVNIIIVNYIPLYVILLKSMAGQLLTSGYSMLAMSFVYLSLCQDFTKKKLENKSY